MSKDSDLVKNAIEGLVLGAVSFVIAPVAPPVAMGLASSAMVKSATALAEAASAIAEANKDHPHVYRTKDGKFRPESGYEWVNSSEGDLRVRRKRT